MNRVTDSVYVGAYPNWYTRRKMRKAGITHIINARRKGYSLKGIEIFHNPMKDEKPGPQDASYWMKSVEFGRRVVESGGKLYVHCKAGVNRGPGHCHAVLRGLGYGEEDAWVLVKSGRNKARPRYVELVNNCMRGR